MPSRIARSSVQIVPPKITRNKNRKRNLDAYAIASHSVHQKTGVRQNRLGEFLDDGPTKKRRRVVQNDDEEESLEEDVPAKPRQPNGNNSGDVEEGSDSEGNEWTLGGLREDDDDSDLDSDEAFGESDEERFEGFTFRGSSSRKGAKSVKHRAQSRLDEDADGDIDLDEDQVQDEDDFGDEGVDLATMLDDEDDAVLGGKDTMKQDMADEDASDDDSETGDEDSSVESDSSHNSNDGAGDEERIARMQDRIDALDSTRQEHAKPAQSTTLTTEDLLAAAAETDPSIRKRFPKASKTKPLSAPLPPRQQNRLNREVASEKAKEQLDRWRDTVIQNRRAEFLSFPLKDPERSEPAGKDKFIDTAPQNELEENIRKIMEESGMVGQGKDENAVMESEELAENILPLEEVMKRRAELRQARELLFREEIKAKRIAKIKSKAYRRVHRKQRERERQGLRNFDEADEDEKERADRKRAEERMSTKHKASKWAKSLRETNRNVWDEEAKDGVQELARRNEELRRRIDGVDFESDDGSQVESSDDSGDVDEDQGGRTLKQLDRIQQDQKNSKEGKGLSRMDFMRAADERQKKQNDEDIERLRKELAAEDGYEDEEEEEDVEDQALGRAIFGPKTREKREIVKKSQRPELEEGNVSENEESDEQETPIVTESSKTSVKKEPVKKQPVKKQSDNKEKEYGHFSNGSDPTTGDEWLSRPTKFNPNTSPAVERQTTLPRKGEAATSSPGTTNTDGWTMVTHEDDDADDETDREQLNPVLTAKQRNSAFNRRSFAGDNTKSAFDAEKAAVIVSEDEKETTTHLPGWGSWTGEGLSKSVRKANTRQRHNPIFKTKLPGVKADDRKDAKLENVMISEKSDRKGKKYKADILPHGFEKKEQYESSLRVPMGSEWVTKETFQRNTRPRVVVKPGVVVRAMEGPLV